VKTKPLILPKLQLGVRISIPNLDNRFNGLRNASMDFVRLRETDKTVEGF
jgi:hypothetical protein